MSLFHELRRRNVFKVGAAYLVVAWLIAQVVDLVLDAFETPPWMMRAVLVTMAAGFVLSLLLAWIYELTPTGIHRESAAHDAGEQVQQPPQPWAYLVVMLLALLAGYLYLSREPAVQAARTTDVASVLNRPTVMVLPFANNSGDDSKDFLAYGITDELISGLQRLGDFPVVSRSTSLAFGPTDISATEVAENNGASYLVEGSINIVSDEIRVLASLSSASGNQVWSERYRVGGGKVDVFDITDELVSVVAGAVLDSEVERVERGDRPPSDAWEHYIKGLKVVLDYRHDEYQAARGHLDTAVEIAPDMAEAWWALGELEVLRYMTGPLPGDDSLEEVYGFIEYFRKAHEISPFHAAACGCLGYMLTAVGQPDEARAVFEQALEAKPLSPDLRLDYAVHLAWTGQYAAAMEQAELALKMGPRSQDRAGAWTVRALEALARSDDAAALEAINRAIFIQTDTFYTPAAVAILYLAGRPAEAGRLLEDLRETFPGLEPSNPVFYVTLKPIDDILSERAAGGGRTDAASVDEIYARLRGEQG
jgi:TolB-like protein/Tfp pilus assembly protein PilF